MIGSLLQWSNATLRPGRGQGFGAAVFTLILALPLAGGQVANAQGTETGSGSAAQLWRPGDPGEKLFLRGRVLDSTGAPVAGAVVNLRQADGDGEYHIDRYQAVLRTDEHGAFSLRTVLPGQYGSAKHIHMRLARDGFQALSTEILFKGDPGLDTALVGEQAIALETAVVAGEQVLLGQVEVVLIRAGDG